MPRPPQSNLSDRLYRRMLMSYPRRFRVRYGAEMMQVFTDCRSQAGNRPVAFWLHTLSDLALSLGREWHGEWSHEKPEIDYTGLMDACIVTVVVGTNLLGWGWMAATVVLRLTVPNALQYWDSAAAAIAVPVTLAMAALFGVLCAAAVGRSGRAERPRLKV